MEKMTKKEVFVFARKRGYEAVYSGKQKRFFLNNRIFTPTPIHTLINEKV
jgi:hypothetical protein